VWNDEARVDAKRTERSQWKLLMHLMFCLGQLILNNEFF
jgi:hypothetical protein